MGKRGWEDRQFKVMTHPPTPTPWNHCNHLNLTVKWILGRKGHFLNIYTITTQFKHRIFGILPWWWIPLVKIYFLNCEFRIVFWLPRVVWYMFYTGWGDMTAVSSLPSEPFTVDTKYRCGSWVCLNGCYSMWITSWLNSSAMLSDNLIHMRSTCPDS